MGAKPRAFKDQLGRDQVARIAAAMAESCPPFGGERFARRVNSKLVSLELKARVRHIIDCLHEHLPQPFPRAVAAIVAAARHDDRRRPPGQRHLWGFAAWPLIDYVGVHGLEHTDLALAALRDLTERFSAEFAIRPFLARDPVRVVGTLQSWLGDRNEHVRRLISEGTRPLLPWGQRLESFRVDPTPVLALLERLADDSSEYVRRSVANNLNDIAKDHPAVVVELCRRWRRPGDPERTRLLHRALRTLVKAGDPAALAVMGYDSDVAVRVTGLSLSPRVVAEGGSVELRFELISTGQHEQAINIDYAVHYVKARDRRSPKTFKLKTLKLARGATETVRKRHPMKPVSTRIHYPGVHTVELLINGRSMATADFELLP